MYRKFDHEGSLIRCVLFENGKVVGSYPKKDRRGLCHQRGLFFFGLDIGEKLEYPQESKFGTTLLVSNGVWTKREAGVTPARTRRCDSDSPERETFPGKGATVPPGMGRPPGKRGSQKTCQ